MKLLLYCTKNGKKLLNTGKYDYDFKNKKMSWLSLNGKIVAECEFEVEERLNYGLARRSETILKGTCLTMKQLDEYLPKHKEYDDKDVFYAIHIKNLNIFDKPRELFNYCGKTKQNVFYHIEKAPQNMMYCYGNNTGEKYILISIRAEWLCKILNGEKTIELRKKVLKEMINDA